MEIRNKINQIKTRDVIVDFFGSLVPGIVFTGIAFILFSSIIFTSVKIISLFISDSVYNFNILSFFSFLQLVINTFRIEFIIFFIILSYIMGHIFYRQDLKYPDKSSFNKIKPDLEKKDRLKKWVADEEIEVEYPYVLNYIDI